MAPASFTTLVTDRLTAYSVTVCLLVSVLEVMDGAALLVATLVLATVPGVPPGVGAALAVFSVFSVMLRSTLACGS